MMEGEKKIAQMEVLFVGGTQNGKWHIVHPGEAARKFAKRLEAGERFALEQETYFRTEWKANRAIFLIYALEGMGAEEIFATLLANFNNDSPSANRMATEVPRVTLPEGV